MLRQKVDLRVPCGPTSKGETLFVPAGLGRWLVVGDAELIKVRC